MQKTHTSRQGADLVNRRAFLNHTLVGTASLLVSRCTAEAPAQKPNILYIMADDLGYGDVGCLGGTMIQTPRIDRMASEGMRFTDHYAGSTVCAPSRSCLMTGLHTGHTPIRGNSEVQPEGQRPLPAGIPTVAGLLKNAGYATGIIGKWGLGAPGTEGIPNKQGFDYFFGYNCQRQAHSYYPDHLWENETLVSLDGNTYAHDLLTEKALAFIRQQQACPFFLYLAYTIPHGRYEAPDDAPYSDKPWPESMRRFASMVHRLDRDTGRVLDLIDELDLAKNTLVIFTSDNGPERYYEKDLPEFFHSSGPLRGIKRDLYEGGIRVPFIARWPGTIQPGQTSGHVAANWDFFPTCAELVKAPVPEGLDGISYLPALLNKPASPHEYFYWEFHERGTSQAVRLGEWKAVRLNPGIPLELYNLKSDIGESRDLAGAHPELIAEFETILTAARTSSEMWPIRSVDDVRRAGDRS